MNGGPRIIPIGSDPAGDGGSGEAHELHEEVQRVGEAPPEEAGPAPWAADDEEPAPHRSSLLRDRLAGSLAVLAILGWTGFFAWANWPAIRGGAAPAEWAQWIVAWSVPVLLCLTLVLVALRTSRREGARFADVARGLSDESARLEARLTTINRELSLAREFVAAQSRDLEALGRIAVERLSGNAERLEALIRGNGERLEAIAGVSTTALENMDKLRGQLPVIANSAKDVANNIGGAGRTAHAQLEELVGGFHRLNEFGVASERQVDSLRERIGALLAEFTARADQLGQIADQRFAALSDGSAHFRERLDQDEIAALAAIRARAAALDEELGAVRRGLENDEVQALAALRARIDALRDEGAALALEMSESEAATLTMWREHVAAMRDDARATLREIETRHIALADGAGERTRAIGDASRALYDELGEAANVLDARLADLRAAAGNALTEQRDGAEAALAEMRRRGAAELAEAADAFARRLAALDAELERRRRAADAAAAEAEAALAERARATDDTLAERRRAAEAAATQAAAGFAARIAEADALIETQRARHTAGLESLAAETEAIAARLEGLGATLATVGAHGDAAGASLAAALDTLAARLAAGRESLAGTDAQVAELTDGAVRLLELIQASSDQTREQLPQALGQAERGLKGLEDRVFMLRDTLGEAGRSGEALHERVAASRSEVGAARDSLAAFEAELAGHGEAQAARLAGLRDGLAAVRGETEALAGEAQGALAAAIERLESAARAAGDALREHAQQSIVAVAEQLEAQSGAAVERAMATHTAGAVAGLEAAVNHAAGAAREAALAMRDQLAKVDELAGNLERRVGEARRRAEEQVDNDFARRVALITESLNSTAIDLDKALSTDVSDTAWAAYLRGDRGIFTRRAVALLDNGQARAVSQHYEGNPEFRGHVNRYIHDFEGMLRQLLSTRDGHALGVTLLSSDMGKLYVALAQAIERLRN